MHFRLCVFALILCLANGCALTTDRIKLAYEPNQMVGKLEGAGQIKVKAEVVDLRTIKDKVSCKKNGYGMEMAPIVSENNVPELISKSIEAELANRGFTVADGNLVIRNELSRCYNDFKIGFWAGDAVAEIIMSVQIKNPGGNIIFSKIITGQFTNQNTMLSTGENAKIALDGALKDAVGKLVNDQEFIASLLSSGSV